MSLIGYNQESNYILERSLDYKTTHLSFAFCFPFLFVSVFARAQRPILSLLNTEKSTFV